MDETNPIEAIESIMEARGLTTYSVSPSVAGYLNAHPASTYQRMMLALKSRRIELTLLQAWLKALGRKLVVVEHDAR